MEGQEQKPSDNQSSDQSMISLNPISAIDAVAPTGWRMKLAKATAQLIAGSEKGAVIYGQMRDRMDTIEGRTLVSNALANAVATQAINDPELVERAKARFLGTAMQQQENIEAVISGTNQYLPLLPAPQDPIEPEAESYNGGAESNGAQPKDEQPLNPDWAATFTGIAENATTDELRDRLSRVLAGELVSPGTYSRATVRAIAELERPDLEAMQSVLPHVLGNELVRTSSKTPLPSIATLLPLTDAALITDANASIARSCPLATTDAEPSFIGGIEWGLIAFINVGQLLRVPVVPLTRTGVAVVDLLGRPDERVILRRIADELPPESYSKILLGRKSGLSGLATPIEQLYPRPIGNMFPPIPSVSPFNG
jgi:hypothetical protein